MTTYISLASSATMFPSSGVIRCSVLTPELIKSRMEKIEVVSALNNDHAATIDAIHRRNSLELPLSAPGPDGRAPQIKLGPGDELFVVQASLPRLKAGEKHSDETVQSAPVSFLRWRVPVRVALRAPSSVPQCVFDEIIDHAHAIALWRRGELRLKGLADMRFDLEGEILELKACADKDDAYLEAADLFYKACCIYYAGNGKGSFLWDSDDPAGYEMRTAMYEQGIYASDHLCTIADIALAKYARRGNGEIFDLAVERDLARPFIRR